MSSRPMQGAMLMVAALGIVVLPGLAFNNLQNNGLISTSQAQTCDATTNACVLSTPVGCSASTAYCQLSGTAISFLNACSPFTNILKLDFVGFVGSFFSNCGQSTTGGITSSVNVNATLSNCAIMLTGGFLMPTSVEYLCTSNTLPYPYYTNQYLLWSGSTSTVLNACLDAFDNCDAQSGALPDVFGNPEPGSNTNALDLQCNTPTQSGNMYAFACNALFPIKGPTPIPGTVPGINATSILSFFFTVVGGALLLLLALGINISIGGSILGTGGTTSLGSNPQGTKMAQTFGVAMVLWFPLYSEFSPWFTSGLMPWGIDGVIGIISIALIACFFVGSYLLSQSGTAGNQ